MNEINSLAAEVLRESKKCIKLLAVLVVILSITAAAAIGVAVDANSSRHICECCTRITETRGAEATAQATPATSANTNRRKRGQDAEI